MKIRTFIPIKEHQTHSIIPINPNIKKQHNPTSKTQNAVLNYSHRSHRNAAYHCHSRRYFRHQRYRHRRLSQHRHSTSPEWKCWRSTNLLWYCSNSPSPRFWQYPLQPGIRIELHLGNIRWSNCGDLYRPNKHLYIQCPQHWLLWRWTNLHVWVPGLVS